MHCVKMREKFQRVKTETAVCIEIGKRAVLYKYNCTMFRWERELHCVWLGESCIVYSLERELHCVKLEMRNSPCKELHCVKLGGRAALCKSRRESCTV